MAKNVIAEVKEIKAEKPVENVQQKLDIKKPEALPEKLKENKPVEKKTEIKVEEKSAEIKVPAKTEIKVESDAKPELKLAKEKSIKILPAEKPVVKKLELKKPALNFKLFGIWDTSEVIVEDAGLKRYINLSSVLAPVSAGRGVMKQFWKSKKNIVERLINKSMQTGHRGKKHKLTSMWITGQKNMAVKNVVKAFKIVESQTKKNPVEVFIRAIEKGSPREGTTQIEYGGVRYPKATDVSPQRRIDLVLRWLTQGASEAAYSSKGKKSFAEALAEQIVFAAAGDPKAMAVGKKTDSERQAGVSR